ncbi:hypothetical protein DFH06DRAFT_1093220 [Mycena polygramma]|nr:hypothetical protein DFH06DRAFT_1093220 [Mycena polygramma]
MSVLLLETDRARLADNLAQILELERSISALRAENSLVQTRIDSYAYPVLTLPNEIVSEIFVQSIPPYPHCQPLTGTGSPTSLAQICHIWREIALATPALWRAIALSLSIPEFTIEQQQHSMDLWLERSRSCPLSIHLKQLHRLYDWRPMSDLSTLLAHRTRWENLRLFRVHLNLVIDPKEPMPLLLHLDLTLDPENMVIRLPEVPRLRSVILSGAAALAVRLPWAQLTSLTLRPGDVSPEFCVLILRQTLNLLHCELRGVSFIHAVQPHITLPYLESLVSNYETDPSVLVPLISHLHILIAPALRHLRIAEKVAGTNPIVSLRAFVSNSGCKLQNVHITGPRRVSEESYRAAFPSILFCFQNSPMQEESEFADDLDSEDSENSDSHSE